MDGLRGHRLGALPGHHDDGDIEAARGPQDLDDVEGIEPRQPIVEQHDIEIGLDGLVAFGKTASAAPASPTTVSSI